MEADRPREYKVEGASAWRDDGAAAWSKYF
jgi:hypothetical protein